MSVKFNLVCVWVVQIDLISVPGIEYYLTSVQGLNWFGCCVGGRDWLAIWMRGGNNLFWVWARKLTCVLCGWHILIWFQCERSKLTWIQSKIKWVWLMCGLSKMTSFQCGGSALIWFSEAVENGLFRIKISWVFVSGHRKWLGFRVGVEINLFFTCRIEINLVLASESNLTFLLCVGQNRLRVVYRPKDTWF